MTKSNLNAKDNITFSDLRMEAEVNKFSDQKNTKTVCQNMQVPVVTVCMKNYSAVSTNGKSALGLFKCFKF